MKQTQVRMPTDIHQWLTTRAKQNDRSMNAELVRILKEVMEGTAEKAAFEEGRLRGIEQASNPAFEEGLAAANAGKPRDSNPYLQTPYAAFLMRLAWYDGWEGKQEDGLLYDRP